MIRKNLSLRIAVLALVSMSFVDSSSFAGPKVSYDPEAGGVRLVRKSEIGGETAGHILVKAKGAAAVAEQNGNLTGVLFQATARPSGQSLPVDLSYTLQGNHDAELNATIGGEKVVSDVPAWVWAVAAKFAAHEATGALTLNDRPETSAEKRFQRQWNRDNGRGARLVWARYHPAVDDTLIGFFLVAADATMGNAQQIRNLPNGLVGFEKYSGYRLALDQAKSSRAAGTLDEMIRLESQPGDCVMLNDVDASFIFSTDNGKLRISGEPHYHFARPTASGKYAEINRLDRFFRANRHVYVDTHPLVFAAVADFARLVAFFDYVESTDPQRLAAFIEKLQPVFDRIPTIDTPAALPLSAR